MQKKGFQEFAWRFTSTAACFHDSCRYPTPRNPVWTAAFYLKSIFLGSPVATFLLGLIKRTSRRVNSFSRFLADVRCTRCAKVVCRCTRVSSEIDFTNREEREGIEFYRHSEHASGTCNKVKTVAHWTRLKFNFIQELRIQNAAKRFNDSRAL